MEKKEIRTNFIENINKLMYERRKSQADVVRDTGIPQARMSTLLSNNKDSKTVIPTVAQLKALADYFGVSMDWLIEKHNDNAANAKINEAAETKLTTYIDVIKSLFLIDEYCDLGFMYGNRMDTVCITFDEYDDCIRGHLHTAKYSTTDKISIRRSRLDKFVVEWQKVKKVCSDLTDKDSVNKLYEGWKFCELKKAFDVTADEIRNINDDVDNDVVDNDVAADDVAADDVADDVDDIELPFK